MTFTVASFYLAETRESRLVAFCFGGKNGQKAVNSNPTGIAVNFDGAITGDLALTRIQEPYSSWSKFHSEYISGEVRHSPRSATLSLEKYSKKGGLLETLFYEFGNVLPVTLRVGSAESGRKTEILTVDFEDIRCRFHSEIPASKAAK